MGRPIDLVDLGCHWPLPGRRQKTVRVGTLSRGSLEVCTKIMYFSEPRARLIEVGRRGDWGVMEGRWVC